MTMYISALFKKLLFKTFSLLKVIIKFKLYNGNSYFSLKIFNRKLSNFTLAISLVKNEGNLKRI